MKILKLTSKNIMQHMDIAEQISKMSLDLIKEEQHYDPSSIKKWNKKKDKYYNLGYLLSNYYTAYAVVVKYNNNLDNEAVAVLWSNTDEEHGASSVHLSFMYVKPGWRRKGYGTKLIKHVLSKVKKNQSVYLNTYEANKAAVVFYEKLGFSRLRALMIRKGSK